MEKLLFQDYSPEERLEMLQNNCDKLMDDVLGHIMELCPEIPIIEV